jgi:hypothetical protein
MAIPSGSGTEVLKKFKWEELDNSPEVAIITGVANHIYTVVSMIFTNSRAGTGNLHVKITDSSAANPNFIIKNQPIPADGTFVWNDKFSIVGTDRLYCYMGSASDDVDVYVTYIDQDWTS